MPMNLEKGVSESALTLKHVHISNARYHLPHTPVQSFSFNVTTQVSWLLGMSQSGIRAKNEISGMSN